MIGDIIIKYHGSDRDQLLKKKKKKELKEKKEFPLGPQYFWSFTLRLSEVTQMELTLKKHGKARTEQIMSEVSSPMARPLVHKGFLKIIRGLLLF